MSYQTKKAALSSRLSEATAQARELELQQLEARADFEAGRAARQAALIKLQKTRAEVREDLARLNEEHQAERGEWFSLAVLVLYRLDRGGVDIGDDGRALLAQVAARYLPLAAAAE
jgi:hypothetical protein